MVEQKRRRQQQYKMYAALDEAGQEQEHEYGAELNMGPVVHEHLQHGRVERQSVYGLPELN